MTGLIREVQCRATVIDIDDRGDERPRRCDWRGPADTFNDHHHETGHEQCAVCKWGLADHEEGACKRCLDAIRDDLADIETGYATLPEIIEHSGYRMTRLPGGDALVMLVDGSMESPQTPDQYTRPRHVGPTVYVVHSEIVGEHVTHPAYLELRVPSDGREHVRDHWKNDPMSIVAALEALERDWRRQLGHGPADAVATVTGSIGYLSRWLTVAAVHLDEFPDFAEQIRELRSRVQHTAGLADDPEPAPAECFDCGGDLLRGYRPLRLTITERLASAAKAVAADDRRVAKHAKRTETCGDVKPLRVPARASRVRHAVAGSDHEGLTDNLTCSRCRRVYKKDEYGLLLRARANSVAGWVTVRVAAETLRRPEQTVWRWIRELEIPSVCSVTTRRVHVDWEAVKALSDEKARRDHDRAERRKARAEHNDIEEAS